MDEFPGPAVSAVGERLLARVDRLADELTAVIRKAEPFYDAGATVPAEDLRGSVRDNLVYILSRLAGRPSPGLGAPRATGRRRAEQGAPLPAILHSYRVAGTFIWSAILDEAAEANAAALLPAASELWSIMDELSGSVTDAHRDTVADRARSNAQTRNAMLDVLLRGDGGGGSRLWGSAAFPRPPPHGPLLLGAGAPDASATVARAILGPILALPAAECDVLLGTLRAWFAEDGATSVAAEKLHVHRNTVRYRLRRVEELTGRSLTQPTGIAELHLALEAARILHLP